MDDLREMLRGHVGDWREAAKIREANAGKPGMEGHVAYGRGLLRAAEIVEECLLATEPAPARPPEPLGSVLDRLADPAADWEQAKADLRTVLTQPVNDPAPEEAATLPKRALRPLTGDALKEACRRLSPPPALEDMDLAGPEEAATGTREPKR